MIAKKLGIKFAVFGMVLFVGSIVHAKPAAANPDGRLPSLVQNYAKAQLAFRADPLHNTSQASYAMMWMVQIQSLLQTYGQAAIQDQRYCRTTMDNYDYLFRKMERFNLDDDVLAVPDVTYIILQNICQT